VVLAISFLEDILLCADFDSYENLKFSTLLLLYLSPCFHHPAKPMIAGSKFEPVTYARDASSGFQQEAL
jgi:hypothetical protein